ncbi:hypothetical protein FACS1894217_05640 [Clostridia bacterium]|nr:hypothetical protein FACS1894217_05640 [Clostridia bacterium]
MVATMNQNELQARQDGRIDVFYALKENGASDFSMLNTAKTMKLSKQEYSEIKAAVNARWKDDPHSLPFRVSVNYDTWGDAAGRWEGYNYMDEAIADARLLAKSWQSDLNSSVRDTAHDAERIKSYSIEKYFYDEDGEYEYCNTLGEVTAEFTPKKGHASREGIGAWKTTFEMSREGVEEAKKDAKAMRTLDNDPPADNANSPEQQARRDGRVDVFYALKQKGVGNTEMLRTAKTMKLSKQEYSEIKSAVKARDIAEVPPMPLGKGSGLTLE